MEDSDGDLEESKEERPKPQKNGKKNGIKRELLESKNTVSASKLANKRSQKEAIKKIKAKRTKGTVKDDSAHAAAASKAEDSV